MKLVRDIEGNNESRQATVRWGILATGIIATSLSFHVHTASAEANATYSARDLLIDPSTRQVTDIQHKLVAAAASSSQAEAQSFLNTCGADPDARAYGSYAELVNDPKVNIIYIASPHSHNYQHVMLCLNAGKHGLCEKAFTVNAAQAKRLAETARRTKLLLVEGLWTRYFPLSAHVRDPIASGRIGQVERVLAEHSLPYAEPFASKDHIMVNPNLAGGILLDAGIYSLTWVFQCLYTSQAPELRWKPIVQAVSVRYSETRVDSMTSILLTFPRGDKLGSDVHGIATSSLGLSIDAISDAQGISVPNVRICTHKPSRCRSPQPQTAPALSASPNRDLPASQPDPPQSKQRSPSPCTCIPRFHKHGPQPRLSQTSKSR